MDRALLKLATITVFVSLLIRLSDECAQCGDRNNDTEISLSAEELKIIRDEIIKREILHKLGLKDTPVISQNLTMPNAEVIKEMLGEIKESTTDDDYYARTRNIVLLPNQIGTESRDSSVLSTTISFHLDPTKFPQGIPSAHLWLYMYQQNASRLTYILYSIETNSSGGIEHEQILHIDHMTNDSPSDWRKYNVTSVLSDRLRKNSDITFSIDCYGCENDPIGTIKEVRPFVVVGGDSSHRSQRNKRHIHCSTNTSHCCLESYRVSFAEIGWDTWIAFPRSYQANFCRGDCHFDASLARYHHTTVMQEVIHEQLKDHTNSNVQICCSPSKMNNLSIMYYADNDTLLTRVMPNMIVKECDCA